MSYDFTINDKFHGVPRGMRAIWLFFPTNKNDKWVSSKKNETFLLWFNINLSLNLNYLPTKKSMDKEDNQVGLTFFVIVLNLLLADNPLRGFKIKPCEKSDEKLRPTRTKKFVWLRFVVGDQVKKRVKELKNFFLYLQHKHRKFWPLYEKL